MTNKIYVSNESDHSISVIDGATDAVTTVSVGFGTPEGIAVDTVANLWYVTLTNETLVFVFDGATDIGIQTVDVGGATTGVAAVPNRGPVLITKFQQNQVQVLRF